MKSCRDFPGAPSCCESCHVDDEEYGYDLMMVNEDTEHAARVCCAVANRISEQTKEVA